MGIETIALIALGVAAAGTVYSIDQGEKGRKDAGKSAAEQRQAQNEQRAKQAQEASNERRQQIREERVRRARILQAGENTGTEGSAAEFGALGGLSTNLSVNIGTNVGRQASANRTSTFLQNAADFTLEAQKHQAFSTYGSQIAGLGGSIFSAAGGFGTSAPKSG